MLNSYAHAYFAKESLQDQAVYEIQLMKCTCLVFYCHITNLHIPFALLVFPPLNVICLSLGFK